VFVTAIDYRLHITKETFKSWTQLVLDVCNYIQHSPPLNPCDMVRIKQCRLDWNRFVRSLNPPAIEHKASVNEDLLQHDFSISIYEVPTDFFQSPRDNRKSSHLIPSISSGVVFVIAWTLTLDNHRKRLLCCNQYPVSWAHGCFDVEVLLLSSLICNAQSASILEIISTLVGREQYLCSRESDRISTF
jgi:hypothetical protein